MLSIHKLSSASQAKSYYEQADYYTKGEDGVDIRSEWLGSGAPTMGLTGAVDSKRFTELLEGKIDSSTTLGAVRNGTREHTPGWDLTFSAPKSLSILALVSGDKRLIDAHKKAVGSMAKMIEERHFKSRRNRGKKKVESVNLDGMVAAAFTHTTSRKVDPQLHTHLVVLNMGRDEAGKYLSVNSLDLFRHKMFLGQIYRNELAKSVRELGYAVQYDEKKGTFEIDGVSQTIIDGFSQRRQDIEAVAESFGYEGGKAMERAALRSRDAKKNLPTQEVVDEWDERLKRMDYTPEGLLSQAMDAAKLQKTASPNSPELAPENLDPDAKTSDLVDLAVKIITHYESVFSYEDVSMTAMKLSKGTLTIADIDRRLAQKLTKNHIVRSEHDPSKYTTTEGIRRERYILDLLEHGRDQYHPLASAGDIERLLSMNGSFTEGQARSFKDLLGSRDRYVGLQGYAGVGKTYMMNPFISVAESSGYTVRGLAPNGTQVEQLERETGLASNTLKSHLMGLETGKIEPGEQELWILDEAGMVNTKDMADLMTFAHRYGVRVVMSGDTHQLGAVEAGNPFHLFMQKGMDYTVNDSIIRQADGSPLKEAIYSIIDRKTEKAFGKLDKDFTEDKDPVMALTARYLEKEDLSFSNVALVVPDIDTRDRVNNVVREHFRELGMLKGDDKRIANLVGSKIDGPMKREAMFYKPGHIVRFNQAYKSLGVETKHYYRVEKVRNGIVYLVNGDQRIEWDPKKVGGGERSTTTYEKKSANYAVGDRVRWKDKAQELELKNGDIGVITQLSERQAVIQFGDRSVQLDLTDLQSRHFQHAYAQTVYSIQGQTYKEALVLAESWRRNLVNQKSFYVAISRAKEKALIFTEDKAKLKTVIDERLGYKGNSFDILSRAQENEYVNASIPQKELLDHRTEEFSDRTGPKSGLESFHRAAEVVEEPGQKQSVARDKQLDF